MTAVVCARNRARVMPRCLSALKAADAAEIIVVDGQSTDRTAAIAREAGVRVVSDQGQGLAAARQLGVQTATYPWVIFVDSDVVVTPTTIRSLVNEAQTDQLDAVQACLPTHSPRASYWQRGEEWRRSVQERPGSAASLGCQATLVRRQLVLELGFDPDFTGAAEDGDFFFRARRSGAKIAVSSGAVAYHEDRRGLVAFGKQRIWHGRGLARMMVKHPHLYRQSLTDSASSASQGIWHEPRYLPFMAVSSVLLGVGVFLETFRLLVAAGRRRFPLGKS